MAFTEVSSPPDPCCRPPGSLTVADGNEVVVHLLGAFDGSSVALLTEILANGSALSATRLVVDLGDVMFMDLATVRVFELAAEGLAGQSRVLALRSPTRIGRRLLAFCGASGLIEDARSGERPAQATGGAAFTKARMTTKEPAGPRRLKNADPK